MIELKALHPGMEPRERVEMLLWFTSIKSPKIIRGLKLVLSDGFSQELAADTLSIPQGNLSRALSTLNECAEQVEKVKYFDWAKFIKNQ